MTAANVDPDDPAYAIVYDLFAGPGGWDVAARAMGLRVLGFEKDEAACATREAAGLLTYQCDVSALNPNVFRRPRGLIGSPPCPTFSAAGKGSGRAEMDLLLAALEVVARGGDIDPASFSDPRTPLVLEPMRWATALLPEWIVMEQVPGALPVWQAMAWHLSSLGYWIKTGVLSAEEYGVPQTRRRAVLVASRLGEVPWPSPTHRAYRKGVARDEGDPALLEWVSMADALGWSPDDVVGFPRRDDGRADPTVINGVAYRSRDLRYAGEPAFALTEKARSWSHWVMRASVSDAGTKKSHPRPVTEPAQTITGKHRSAVWQSEMESVPVAVEEAAMLQTFPADHPWQGSRTKQFEQIGNAVPPLLAAHILSAATGLPVAMPTTSKEIAA